jgi:two-component system alkaline phosphatase synthesis response regulator PhoP
LVRRILKHKKDAYALVLMNIEQKSLFEDLYENGADEIVPSNVDIDLFKLRLNKIIDRSKKYGKLLTKKNIYIDKEKYLVYLDDRELTLPKKEFELLSLLVSKPHKVFSREEIYKLVWGTRIVVGDRTIDVHIRKIREEIGEGKIQTIKGVGYKYIG